MLRVEKLDKSASLNWFERKGERETEKSRKNLILMGDEQQHTHKNVRECLQEKAIRPRFAWSFGSRSVLKKKWRDS